MKSQGKCPLVHKYLFQTKIFYISGSTNTLKYISLITLTVQNALLGLSMRYARTREGDMFVSSTGMHKKFMFIMLC